MLTQAVVEALGIIFHYGIIDTRPRRQCRPPYRDVWDAIKDGPRRGGTDDVEITEER